MPRPTTAGERVLPAEPTGLASRQRERLVGALQPMTMSDGDEVEIISVVASSLPQLVAAVQNDIHNRDRNSGLPAQSFHAPRQPRSARQAYQRPQTSGSSSFLDRTIAQHLGAEPASRPTSASPSKFSFSTSNVPRDGLSALALSPRAPRAAPSGYATRPASSFSRSATRPEAAPRDLLDRKMAVGVTPTHKTTIMQAALAEGACERTRPSSLCLRTRVRYSRLVS